MMILLCSLMSSCSLVCRLSFIIYMQVRVWAPEDQINGADLALSSANVTLSFYEEYFDVNYPLPKQG